MSEKPKPKMSFILISSIEKCLRKYGIPLSFFDFPVLFDQIEGFLGLFTTRVLLLSTLRLKWGVIIGTMAHILELDGLSLQQKMNR